MELTQRLESSQEIIGNNSERLCPEQIGFLGICGTKYPVTKGCNKIGRDPQTCDIVLNLNSISRHHAVLNILSSYDFMIMDLGSANKTKLQNKTLDPYIPYPLRNGDTLQFGQVFGIFRLLEEDTDLPMTQALEIPETPIVKKHYTKINHTAIIPESPDVSDKGDSFIASFQPKEVLRSSKTNFLKSSENKILIQPVGQKQKDNLISFDNESVVSGKLMNINDSKTFHEMDTQITDQDSNVSIYEANTQLPYQKSPRSPNIYSMETQVPILDDLQGANSATVASKEIQIHQIAENKENNISIFNTDLQLEVSENKTSMKGKCTTPDTSDDVIVFDEIDSQPFEDILESQAILPSSPILLTKVRKSNSPNTTQHGDYEISTIKIKIINSSTDCDDFGIVPTQMLPTKPIDNQTMDDLEDTLPTQMIKKTGYNADETGCEDKVNVKKTSNTTLADDEDVTDCEDNFDVGTKNVPQREINMFDDLKTQVRNTEKCTINSHSHLSKKNNIQDQSVHILVKLPIEEKVTVSESILENKALKHINTSTHIFKVPSLSPRKSTKNISKYANDKKVSSVFDDGYCDLATQEISEDFLAQKEHSHPVTLQDTINTPEDNINQSFELEDETKIDELVSALSSQEIRDIVGVETKNTKLRRYPSDGSNCEGTPKKVTILQFMDNDLPNSQEIKTCLAAQSRTADTIYTSESETENDSQQGTPILFKKKQRKTSDFKLDLSKKFDADLLPSRFSTRVKKPPTQLNGFEGTNISILKSNIVTDPEEDIDIDIITENILRLKSYKSKNMSIDNTSNLSIRKSRKTTTETREEETYCDKSKSSNTEQKIPENKGLEKKNLNTKISNKITITTKKTSKTKKDAKTTTYSKSIQKDSNATNVSETIGDKTEHPKKPQRKKDNEAKLTNIPETSVAKTRQTRSRKKPQENNNQEIIIPKSNKKRILKRSSSYTDLSDTIDERKERIKVTDNVDSSGKVLRRSTRQRSKKAETTHNLNNQSTVYSTSPQSMKSLGVKRRATDELMSPAKKSRPATALGLVTNFRPTSARRKKTQFVLFTAFPSEEAKSKLEDLGAVIVSDVKECTVVLTLQIKRTFKLLCAVGLGKPIVGPQWVQACVDNRVIVDPWLYLIHDEATEKRFHFNLHKSLVGKRNFLKGIYVSSTPSVMPSAPEMKLIVECSGGTWSASPPAPATPSTWVVVSCHADRALWPALRERGAAVVSTEFILGGVLEQRLQIDRNKLA